MINKELIRQRGIDMGRTLEDLFSERLVQDPSLRQYGLTGENARMMSNPEDRRQFRSGNGEMYYTPAQPPAPPLSQQQPPWWQRFLPDTRPAQAEPIRRVMTPEEELLVRTQAGQLEILNRGIR